MLYLEDFQPGQTFVTETFALDAEAIKTFARQFDPQPFHIDEEAAKGTFFNGLAASGWHTAAVTMRLLLQGGPQVAGGLIGAGNDITWPRPTRPGDVLQVVCEILTVTPSKSRKDIGIVAMRSETRNQRSEPVQIMLSKLVVPRRPASAVA
jgi:acyl dehydratase